jgi:hypothetical protein
MYHLARRSMSQEEKICQGVALSRFVIVLSDI